MVQHMAALSLHRFKFDPKSIHVSAWVGRVAGRSSCYCTLFFPRQHLLLMLSTHFHVNTPLTRACGLSVGTIKQTNAPSDIGQHWTEQYFHNVSSSIFDDSN